MYKNNTKIFRSGKLKLLCHFQKYCFHKTEPLYPSIFKVKAEQIKVLREKYENLLEEDKKRKERNEYILDRLDRMRMSPSNYRSRALEGASIFQNKRSPALKANETGFNKMSTLLSTNNEPKNIFLNNIDSKQFSGVDLCQRFILIPKTLSPGDRNTLNIDPDVNTDWKSKYEILNQLKQAEKEDIGNDKYEFSKKQPELKLDTNQEELGIISNQEQSDKNILDSIFKEKNYTNYSDEYSRPRVEDLVDEVEKQNLVKSDKIPTKIAKDETPTNDTASHDNKPSTEIKPYPITEIRGGEQIEYLDDEGFNPAHISYTPENIGQPFGDIPDNTDGAHYPIKTTNVDDLTRSDNNIVSDINNSSNINPEHYEYDQNHPETPFELNRETFSAHNTVAATKADPSLNKQPSDENKVKTDPDFRNPKHEAASNRDHDNIVPVSTDVEEHGETTVDYADIEAFETEQNEIFTHEVSYDQEPPKVHQSPLDENYQQNDQYYYDQHLEQHEPVQVNEYEETSTPYDQNYQQQYMTNYEQQPQQEYADLTGPFDQLQVGSEQPQQYDPEQQQEFNAQQYHQEYEQIPAQYDEGNYEQFSSEAAFVSSANQDEAEAVEKIQENLDREGLLVEPAGVNASDGSELHRNE